MVDGRRERGAHRRAALLAAGIQLVADHGPGSLTHRAVALAAGVSVASVTYHFATAHELRDSVFRAAGTRIRNSVAATVLSSQPPTTRLSERYGQAARLLVSEELAAVATAFEMILAARHDNALAPAAESLSGRLAAHLEATVGRHIDGPHIAACIQGLVLASICLPDSSRGPWLEKAIIEVLDRMFSPDPSVGTAPGQRGR